MPDSSEKRSKTNDLHNYLFDTEIFRNTFNEYLHGKALGLIAIARHARGVYALSYDEEGEGTYQFSPKRQDPETVALFTQRFRKLKKAFVSSS